MNNNDDGFGHTAETKLRISVNTHNGVIMDCTTPDGQPIRLMVDPDGALYTAELLIRAAYRLQNIQHHGILIMPLEAPAPTERNQQP